MALVQSTSPHYWFLASLDSARRQLALHGTELVGQAVSLARKVRSELNGIDGLYSFGTEITAYDAVGAFDETKVTIDFSGLGMDGRQAEKLLRQEGVEAELTAGNHVLALITMGDDEETARTLCRACRRVAEGQAGRQAGTSHRMAELPLPVPRVIVPPQEAWNAETEAVPFAESLGRVAAETVTFYPPGIPAVGLGEEITADVMIYIKEKLARGYSPNGPADGTLGTIRVIKEG